MILRLEAPSDGTPYAKDMIDDFIASGEGQRCYSLEGGRMYRVYYSIYNYLKRWPDYAPGVRVYAAGGCMYLTNDGRKVEPVVYRVNKKKIHSLIESALKVADARSMRYMRIKQHKSIKEIGEFFDKRSFEVVRCLRTDPGELNLSHAIGR